MPTGRAEYRLAPKATEDLEAVWLYSLTEWGGQQPERYVDDLAEAFDFLAQTPKAGKACDNIRPGYRRYPVIRHMLYYRETTYGVEIIRVLHDHMLQTRRF
jgi:toxin ParE1/3/4